MSTRSPDRKVQFRLWHLFMVLTLAAIALTIAALYVRSWTTWQWVRITGFGAAAVVGCGLQYTPYALYRGRSEKRLGPIAFRAGFRLRSWWLDVHPLFFAAIAALTLGVWMVIIITTPNPPRTLRGQPTFDVMWFPLVVGGVLCGQMTTGWMVKRQDRRRLLIGEHGVLMEVAFIPWHRMILIATENHEPPRIRWFGCEYEIRAGDEAAKIRDYLERHCTRKK